MKFKGPRVYLYRCASTQRKQRLPLWASTMEGDANKKDAEPIFFRFVDQSAGKLTQPIKATYLQDMRKIMI